MTQAMISSWNVDEENKASVVIIERLNRKKLKADRLEAYYSLLRSFVKMTIFAMVAFS
jgi:hypothetical protein